MKFNDVKKNLLVSIVVFIIMILLLILLSSGESSAIKSIISIIILAASVIFIGIIWSTFYQQLKTSNVSMGEVLDAEVYEEIVHTGTTCEISGLYQCVEHNKRRVNMKKGKRFPPCKGNEKGHSTDWKLIKKATK